MSDNSDALRGTLDILYKNLKTGLIGAGVAAVSASVLLYYQNDDVIVFIWLILMLLSLLLRGYDLCRWNKLELEKDKYHPIVLKRYSALTLGTALLWCVFGLYFSTGADSNQMVIVFSALAAVNAGVTNSMSSSKSLIISYITLTLLPFGLWSFYQGGEQKLFGFLGVTFTALLSFSARNSYIFTLQSIRLRREHQHLLVNLETEVKLRTKELLHLSNTEPLTGLYNRSRFIELTSELIKLSQINGLKLAFVIVDLVDLKSINDSLGHEVGDEYIRATANRLREIIQEPAICCRWGGDEFLIAIPIIDSALADFVKNLQQSTIRPLLLQGNVLKIKNNIGVSIYPDHSQKISELIIMADLALYDDIEKCGKQLFTIYNRKIGERYQRKSMLRSRLEHAIEKKELRLVFQPIVHQKDVKKSYYEVLLRWNLNGEAIPPDEFIPLAEQSDLINSIGHWVFEQSCLVIWQSLQRNQPIELAVNVSAVQFQQEEFVGELLKLVDKHHIPRNLLQIEITESIFTANKNVLIDKTKQLRYAGIAISIDDFGTGYSSLSVINELHLNKVKIDKAFIEKIEHGGMPVLHAIASMSQSMGWEVVAEGVETSAQVEILRNMGIQYLQGYYFSKPVEYSSLFPKL
ncbi:putative bifunctional diguanylate cyclase/phosphodiesterase [Rheinheimera texasensis]|uniref:putative bifunctional diguanylate cyclase/phosphodiesterase n=1 Tax=Rheinheimera texasensis TaxID=306205 RepID=UPI0004E24993|nr:bifunctional diguanylate cyclase/phosphodiesterase [Rheinheimera texasensis]